MLRIFTLLLAAWMLAVPTHTAAQEKATLASLRVTPDAMTWRAVGRLDAAMSGFCTATLIAPDLLLTAAHCVYSSKTNRLIKPAGLTFRAGLQKGKAVAERRIVQVEVHPGYDASAGPSAQSVGHDVALLRLAEPIGADVLDPFSVQDSAQTHGPVSVVSYGKGRAESLSAQSACEVLDGYQNVILMDCEATFGSSGAPIFNSQNGRREIISLVSSIGQFRGKRTTYGMILPKLVADLKDQMRANQTQSLADAS
ncbi:hypothetical protein ROLI_001440 [Roseobacter fucihabitans]|uniref:Peptidase S1 domain-containing protein n=1 Tax=Roseobacter fucihabitans TaxID=1537242 RepID=A0ABZ2BQA1_9RHOB|nr:trypsin-like peptidase domain-containing protein [Roseobacter litoralis]MBC6963394.1 Trypsin precursor [Roseobacter litoralis]